MSFAPEYIDCVLRENFADGQALFLSPLMALHDVAQRLLLFAEAYREAPRDLLYDIMVENLEFRQ